MKGQNRLIGVLAIAAIAAYCSACTHGPKKDGPSGSQRRATGEGHVTTKSEDPGPEIWIHGVAGSPDKATQLHAKGVRTIVSLRGRSISTLVGALAKYGPEDLGICITVRWEEGRSADGRARWDSAPSAEEESTAIEDLLTALNSDAAKAIQDRLWVQFYNEFTGGPGQIRAEDMGRMFEFATRAAGRIRAEAPHVKICGPAITAPEVLDSDRSGGRAGERSESLRRGIKWSVENADAVDLHLHMPGGDQARRWLAIVRREMNAVEGGENIPIVSWEWSAARYPDRSDLAGAWNATIEVYRAMAQAHVSIAAYSGYFPAKKLGDVFQWASLVNDKGHPNQPFYQLVSDLAAGKIALTGPIPKPDPGLVGGGGEASPDQGDTNGNGRRRRQR